MKTLQKTLITTGGILFALFGTFHMLFWSMFDWKNELARLSTVNSNIMQMLNIGCGFIVFSFACIFIFYRNEVINSKLGKILLVISGLFYYIRLVMEFVFPEGSLVFGLILLLCGSIYVVPAFIK
jgi:hypothetical protein